MSKVSCASLRMAYKASKEGTRSIPNLSTLNWNKKLLCWQFPLVVYIHKALKQLVKCVWRIFAALASSPVLEAPYTYSSTIFYHMLFSVHGEYTAMEESHSFLYVQSAPFSSKLGQNLSHVVGAWSMDDLVKRKYFRQIDLRQNKIARFFPFTSNSFLSLKCPVNWIFRTYF